jgi:hypothetical protein
MLTAWMILLPTFPLIVVAMVRHNTGDGDVPNDAVVCQKMMYPSWTKLEPFFKLHHGWWEQPRYWRR